MVPLQDGFTQGAFDFGVLADAVVEFKIVLEDRSVVRVATSGLVDDGL